MLRLLVAALVFVSVQGDTIQMCGKSLMRHMGEICEGKNTIKRSFLGYGSLPSAPDSGNSRLADDLNTLRSLLESRDDDDDQDAYTSGSSFNRLLGKWLTPDRPRHLVNDFARDTPSEPRIIPLMAKRGNLISQCCQKGCKISDLISIC